MMRGLLDYRGPADMLDTIRAALQWVKDPVTGEGILAAGRVRQVRVDGGSLHVVLAITPGPLLQVVVEDLRAELFDHLRGWSDICVRIQPPGAPGWCSGACGAARPRSGGAN